MSAMGDLAAFLAASGLGIYDTVTAANNPSTIFTHWMPPVSSTTPASVLSIELYGSAPPGPYLLDDTLPMAENPRLKLTARDPIADAALARVQAAYTLLIGLSDVTLGGVHYFSIRSVNGPAWNGTQDSNQGTLYLYGCNVQACKTLS